VDEGLESVKNAEKAPELGRVVLSEGYVAAQHRQYAEGDENRKRGSCSWATTSSGARA
jgi:hypothetical protein